MSGFELLADMDTDVRRVLLERVKVAARMANRPPDSWEGNPDRFKPEAGAGRGIDPCFALGWCGDVLADVQRYLEQAL